SLERFLRGFTACELSDDGGFDELEEADGRCFTDMRLASELLLSSAMLIRGGGGYFLQAQTTAPTAAAAAAA
ncbi:hypothetical protein PENTCL1PPCAC_12768, partial [Pristionchus entomophagus]